MNKQLFTICKKNIFLLSLFVVCNINNWAQSTRVWSSYFGYSDNEEVRDITSDATGNVYVIGTVSGATSNLAFAGHQNVYGGGASDAFLVKFDATGNRIWATYFGGNDVEQGWSVDVDNNGDVIICGGTLSLNNIAFSAFQNTYGGTTTGVGTNGDGFIAKFNSSGVLLWSTYYGGNEGDLCTGVDTDANGNIYVSGVTESTNNIAQGGFQNNLTPPSWDAFVVKFDSFGNRIWGTYYGGANGDNGNNICVDLLGNVYLLGETFSLFNISFNGFQNTTGGITIYPEPFIVKFNSAGNRLWATYYGGSSDEMSFSICCDIFGNVIIAGHTQSTNNMASAGSYQSTINNVQDVFLAKFSPSGNRLWGTYFGGNGPIDIADFNCVSTDGVGNIFLSGYTGSTGNIAVNGFQNSNAGGYDGFLAKFDPNGNLLCSTYFGGSGNEEVHGVYANPSGTVYLTGTTTSNSGIAFGGWQNTFGGGNFDSFIAKFTPCINNVLTVSVSSVDVTCFGLCNASATANAIGTAPFTYSWNTMPIQTTQTATGLCAGTYVVTVTDASNATSTASITISQPTAINLSVITTTPSICNQNNGSISIVANGGTGSPAYTYAWSPSGGNASGAINLTSGSYTVTVSDVNGCTQTISATVGSQNNLTINLNSTNASCLNNDGTVLVIPSNGTPGYNYSWNPNIGSNTANINNLSSGTYTVTVTDAAGCTKTSVFSIGYTPASFAQISSSVAIANGSSTIINASGGNNYNWFSSGIIDSNNGNSIVVSPNETTTYCVEMQNNIGCKDTACVTINVETICPDFNAAIFPNSFSPNNDGVNDEFCINNLTFCVDDFLITVFNRWGEKVYESTEPNFCWNGIFKNKIMEPQVFAYVIKGKSIISKMSINYGGNITLIR